MSQLINHFCNVQLRHKIFKKIPHLKTYYMIKKHLPPVTCMVTIKYK